MSSEAAAAAAAGERSLGIFISKGGRELDSLQRHHNPPFPAYMGIPYLMSCPHRRGLRRGGSYQAISEVHFPRPNI